MNVLVLGSGSEIGQHILKQLAERKIKAVAIAETDNQAAQLKDYGADEVFITDNDEFSEAYKGCDQVIFIAGARPISGETQDMLVDVDFFKKSLEESKKHQVKHFIYLSAVRSDETEETETIGDKQKPEELLQQENLTYTIIRPSLTVNKPGKDTVKAAKLLKITEGEIAFEDAAAFLVEALGNPAAQNQVIEITAGDTPIEKAFENL